MTSDDPVQPDKASNGGATLTVDGSEVQNGSTAKRPHSAPDEFFANKQVSESFAAFLRANTNIWRLRRHDRFTPLDFHLAEHQLTLQGRIDKALLERFRDQTDLPELDEWDISHGDELTFYLPALSEPKELLIEFSSTDEAGQSLPILTRMDGSQVSAAYVLSALTQGAEGLPEGQDAGDPLDDQDIVAATMLLTLLAYQNPNALAVRINHWPMNHGRLPRRGPLPEDALEDWIFWEGELFRADLGEPLLRELAPLIRGQSGGQVELTIPEETRQGGLAHFPTVSSLALHSIRDLLRIVIEFAPEWVEESSDTKTRADLLGDPELLARAVAARAEHGLRIIGELWEDGASEEAKRELFRVLPRWTAYVICTVRLGVPFLVKFKQVLPLSARLSRLKVWLRALSTKLDLPIAFKDAAAVHVEITLRDPELSLGRGIRVISGDEDVGEPSDYFGTTLEASEQVVQFYSSRRDGERSEQDAPLGRLYLRVPLRLTLTVWLGYALTAFAMTAAAVYLVVVWWRFLRRGETLEVEPVATVSALAITISLWLTTVAHRRPIVHRKLVGWRLWFVITLFAMLAGPVCLAVRELVGLR